MTGPRSSGMDPTITGTGDNRLFVNAVIYRYRTSMKI
jgi:hypothetical protein